MNNQHSMRAVIIALIGNIIITILKYAVAIITRSSAMLAESIHTTADCANQILLIIGDKRSQKEPDEMHSFGYSKEEFFWGFLVAVLLFFGGAIFTIYIGIQHLLHPKPLEHIYWSIAIIIISILIEGNSFRVAYKQFRHVTKKPLFKGIKEITDTNILIILMEDFAALVGLIIVLISTILSILFNTTIFDSIGSILIGLLLAYVSYTVSNEIRKSMIGENIPREMRTEIKNIVKQYSSVKHINKIQAELIGRNKFMLLLSIDFEDDCHVYLLEDHIEQMKLEIRERYPNVDNMYIELKDTNRNNKI